ncbi:hypothetical protein [Rhizobium ruizarguesonis]|uniref:hypothetical protein n=1 Tax=Rhizobium ruizarguesonis TaxID=2081791 RepID=UPI0013B61F3D|nr:hypothetical protein [Rhizobium ruizarguesonis]NEH64596.1 hypothetical protein [Rhizobium ruizarguesonis]NEH78088.1 hypothetical protein [Rhizobium ruizarguesonis]NEI78519.1 hypothetical protein [Rhizobium ruizarguesonis]
MKPSEFFEALRKKADEEPSLALLARELDVDYQNLRNFVLNRRSKPTAEMLDILADRYGFSICGEAANESVSA